MQPRKLPKSNSPSRRRSLRLFRTWQGKLLLLLLLVGGLGGGFWFNEYRTMQWGEALNPAYWYHRWRGKDLYLPEEAVLLRGNRALPEVALTFDDGPHRESRAQILAVLKHYGVHATFFDVGRRMEESPDLLRRTLAEGHEVANHSTNHNRLPGLSPALRHREINDTDTIFYRITGQHLSLLRPPGMRYTPEVLADTKAMGYLLVGYTTAARDFDRSETADFIAQRTLRRTENGSIILLHDYRTTAQALPRIIENLKLQGFRCVTISEMIDHLPAGTRQDALAFLHR